MSSQPVPSLAQAGSGHWRCPLYEEEGERRRICGVVEERIACGKLRESAGDFCMVVLFLRWFYF